MKSEIYDLLSQSSSIVSGEVISNHLGVSRVAVWKHIQQMQAAGFEIESTAKGYILKSIPDTLFSWQFGKRSNKIHAFNEVSSTMEKALAMAKDGCPNFSVVVAEKQTHGRGRLNRAWQSDKGGLYFTVILKPDIPPSEAAKINFAAALELVHTLNELCGIRACLKWPNDVLVENAKLAGILSQMVTEMDMVQFLSVGVGINVNNCPTGIDPPAVSVFQLVGRKTLRAQILSCFLDRFEKRLTSDSLKDIVPDWKQKTITLGRRVKVKTTRNTYEGLAIDIENDGGLILELADGSRQKIIYGDCFHTEG
ncbi:MAG: biotin--[acetyl-CoA-carboxylase] ligase [Desulfobacteraceae bacterium]|nr:biotin--[acetyl-CoA-carboxylase] ligase [Desulfobacteraceae bacterium]